MSKKVSTLGSFVPGQGGASAVRSNSPVPHAAKANSRTLIKGSMGNFVPMLHANFAQPGNVAPAFSPPLAAMHASLKKGVHFE